MQCTSGQDVETYQDFSYNGWNLDAIREKARNTIELTRARARATTAPAAGEYRLILSGGYVNEFMSYYVNRASSFAIHQKYSTFSAGCDVQGGEVSKDRVNMTMKSNVPFSDEVQIPSVIRKILIGFHILPACALHNKLTLHTAPVVGYIHAARIPDMYCQTARKYLR